MSLKSSLLSNFQGILLHGQNQHQAMGRALLAKSQGLPPETYGTPCPGSNVTTTTTTNNNAGGLIRGAILSAIMLTAGGAGTIGASKYFAPQSPTPAAEVSGAGQTPKPPAAEKTPAWNAIIEQQQSDGTWKQIGEQHLQPGS